MALLLRKRVDLSSQRFQELVSSTLQPDLTPDGVEPAKREEVKANPLLSCSEPVDVITAFGAGQEVG